MENGGGEEYSRGAKQGVKFCQSDFNNICKCRTICKGRIFKEMKVSVKLDQMQQRLSITDHVK